MQTTTDTSSAISPDTRPHFAAACDTLREVVVGIRPDDLDRPTPCTDMTVRQLVDHVGMALGRVTAAGGRKPLEEWPTEEFRVEDDIVAGIDGLVVEALAAWDDDRLVEQIELPWTVLPGNEALATYVNEVLVHSWDLATATGQHLEYDDEAIAVADALMHDQLPVPERAAMWEQFAEQMPEGIPFVVPFDDAVPVADDAPAIVRLVAWNGRRP